MFEKIKNSSAVLRINAFMDSVWFALAFGAAMLLLHILTLNVAGFIVIGLCLIYVNLFCADTRPALPILFTGPLVVSSLGSVNDIAAYFFSPAILVLLGLLVACVVVTALLRLFLYRKAANMFKKRRLLYGFVLLAAAFLFSGLFSKYYSADSLLLSLSLILTQLIFYMFFSATMDYRKDNTDYVSKVCVITAAVIVIQLLWFYIRNYTAGQPLDSAWKGNIFIGWGMSNTIGQLLTFMLPMCFYRAFYDKKGWLYYIFAFVVLAAVYFTLSRNALIFGAAVFIGGTVLCLVKGGSRKITAIVAAVFAAALILFAVLGLKTEKIDNFLAFFTDTLLSDRGRFALWKKMAELFTEYPVFGTGFSALGSIADASMKMAHNTLIQILSSCGVVGLGCYFFHRFQTVKLFLTRPTLKRLFFGFTIAVYIGMGLLDPIFFYANYALIYTVLLIVSEKDLDAEVSSLDKESKAESLKSEQADSVADENNA